MITQNLDISAAREKFPDARQETDGSITFECPVCRAEGHHNKQVKIYANGAISCARFAGNGDKDASRQHCAPIREMLGLVDSPHRAFITKPLFNGKLTVECSQAERGKVLLVARNCDAILNRDVISLDRAKERNDFIKGLPDFDTQERKEIDQMLKQLADEYERVSAAIDEEETDGETKHVIFAELPDGRLIEQVAGGMFAVYDPKARDVSYVREVKTDAGVYRPLQDDFVLKGGLFLPERLIEYGDDKALDAEIEACINRYSDVPKRERKLSAKYARLSYVADKLNEISYLRATGEPGSGKSRYICTAGMLCLRPVLVTSPSAASLYRMMDAYTPTLIIDECNLAAGSEDTDMLIQILNSGFQRIANIPRVEKGADGQLTIRMFSPFGPKLIGGLKLSDSAAFESRCVQVAMQKTQRKDIPFRLTAQMLNDFAGLRAKLYLWRLRNLSRDYEQALDDAERELKGYQIEPRFVQIAIPIYGLIDDGQLKEDFARMLETRTDDAASDKQESFDGQIVATIHRLLFEVDGEGKATWKPFGNCPEPEEGRPIELATVDQITATINDGLPEKKRHDSRWIGKEVRKLGFKTREIKGRESTHYRKSAVLFERITFARLLENYSLPLPQDFDPPNPLTTDKANNDIGLRWADQPGNLPAVETSSAQRISLTSNDLDEVSGLSGSNFRGERGEEFSEPSSAQIDAISNLVALDTETERFDPDRGVTPRTARMIGLALSHDGEGQTGYETDREAWPLLMPEPEQTVIMHNAKFDLGVLARTGLPTPEKWEDTMIAAHLLDETGEHGLKPLAKEHLNIEDPMTFDEADRMRLLDPEVFSDYAKNDARYTFRLWPQFRREMERQGLLAVYALEKAVVPAVMAMEDAGMKIDLSRMAEMSAEVKAECERIKSEIFGSARCHFDLNSPKKVSTILYEKLGLPCNKETATGQASVDKEALEEIRGYHPAVDAILRYREIDKLASTFLSVLPTFADEAERIHPEFKQLGATSGRFSCSNPNVQQIPSRSELGKKLRRMFIADEGNALVVADWSQMELRILAHYSKDPLLLEAYASGHETDLHTSTAARMFGKGEADVSKPERSIAKMINFGIAYGITPIGLFNRLRPQGVDVTEEDCGRFIADYFSTHQGVRKFLDQVEPRLRERGYVRNWFGRRRRVSGQTAREVRQAQNFIIQATAADMAKSAMVRLHGALPDGARLIAMVHDEFIVECRAGQAEEVRGLVIEAMQDRPEGFTVQMVVEAKIAGNWGDAK